jgi:putative tryptophan/tyrosine transport system substrate-binding protein
MRRREVIAALGGATVWGAGANAQRPSRMRRIGLLMAYTENDPEVQERLAAFGENLRQAGWIEGRNVRIDVRWHAGDPERAKTSARELVQLDPDILIVNGTHALTAARLSTRSVPIVFVVVVDPIGAGFIPSLFRPGGNITGFSTFEPEMGGKWLEALKEIAPHLGRVGILTDRKQTIFARLRQSIEAAAPSFGFEAVAVDASDIPEIDRAIESFAQRPNGGLVVLPDPIYSVNRNRIYSLTVQHRLPAVYPFAFHARSGGLIAYGFDAVDLFRKASAYVDRILKGERSGDLPVQAPTKFELIINLKTARALGLDVPQALLARADEVIE